ncbi:MAG: hypothetical protein ACFNKL_07110 [Treponema sp.]
MKKCLTILIVLLSFLPCFAQEYEIDSTLEQSESNFKISLLDEKLLIHQPHSGMFTKFQNPSGKIFSSKEVKAMLLEVSENKPIMKSYNIWKGLQYSLIGTSIASLAVCTVYTIANSAPYADDIAYISALTGILSFYIALPVVTTANLRYLEAVDNYNLNLLKK